MLLSFSAPHLNPADIPATLGELQALVARGGSQEVVLFLSDAGVAADDCRNIAAAVEAFPTVDSEHVRLPVWPKKSKNGDDRLEQQAQSEDEDETSDTSEDGSPQAPDPPPVGARASPSKVSKTKKSRSWARVDTSDSVDAGAANDPSKRGRRRRFCWIGLCIFSVIVVLLLLTGSVPYARSDVRDSRVAASPPPAPLPPPFSMSPPPTRSWTAPRRQPPPPPPPLTISPLPQVSPPPPPAPPQLASSGVPPAPAPPPAPTPPLSTLAAVPRLGAQLSSTYASSYAASMCIDDDPNTLCASTRSLNPWLRVQVAPDTTVDYVSVAGDGGIYQGRLSPFELWLDTETTPCHPDTATYQLPASRGTGPFVYRCSGAVSEFVTLRLSGPIPRPLSLAEFYVYSGPPSPPPSPWPAHPQPQPPPLPPWSPFSPSPPPMSPSPPSPPAPVPPLWSMEQIAPIRSLNSNMGSAWLAIDGDMVTTAIVAAGASNSWLSIKMPPRSLPRTVAVLVYPGAVTSHQESLSQGFEIWRGGAWGDIRSQFALRCSGDDPVRVPAGAGPFAVYCSSDLGGDYLMLRQAGPHRVMGIAEIEVYVGRAPSMPPSPPPPSPPPIPPASPPVGPSPPSPPLPPRHPPFAVISDWEAGFAQRIWGCCKPSCSFPQNHHIFGDPQTPFCDVLGNRNPMRFAKDGCWKGVRANT
jgi:hypothetical protein